MYRRAFALGAIAAGCLPPGPAQAQGKARIIRLIEELLIDSKAVRPRPPVVRPPPAVKLPPSTGLAFERTLVSAYERRAGLALAAISNAAQRERIMAVLARQPIADVAAVAGRERQFQLVSQHADMTLSYRLPEARELSDDENRIVSLLLRDHVRRLFSAAAEDVPLTQFSAPSWYRVAFRSAIEELARLRRQAGEAWKFNVQTGALELPFKRKLGNVEFTAGELDVFDFAGSVAQLIFGSPSSAAATGSSDNSSTPTTETVRSEKAGRRRLLASLSSEDVAVLKQVAPDLFVA